MLAEWFFLVLVVVVSALMIVDVVRTRSENPHTSPSGQTYGSERGLGAEQRHAAPSWIPGTTAFSREPSAGRTPGVSNAPPATIPPATVPAAAAAASAPARETDEAARGLRQMRRAAPSAADAPAASAKPNAMFANLSRRSQSLVERQLRIIESLEHGEHDQQRLASLARLNRIAMRMHRNAQNLLVLAGTEAPIDWNQPVALAQVVEAALSEVEGYERVSAEVQPGIAVRGPAVHDLLHLLVELVDNAASFSAADMPVQIKGQALTTGGVLIDITDLGIGMAAGEMADANQLLDNFSAGDVEGLKWMGLPVVARLAARHGIRVRLNQAEFGGLTALVWLPDEILTHFSSFNDPGYTAAGSRAAASPPAEQRPAQQAPASRPDPAWSAPGTQTMVQTPPPAAVRLAGSSPADAASEDAGVVVPQADSGVRARGLPIFEQVESRWSRTDQEPRGSHAAPAGGPQNRSGLPSRDRTAGYQRGSGQGWGASAEESAPDRADES